MRAALKGGGRLSRHMNTIRHEARTSGVHIQVYKFNAPSWSGSQEERRHKDPKEQGKKARRFGTLPSGSKKILGQLVIGRKVQGGNLRPAVTRPTDSQQEPTNSHRKKTRVPVSRSSREGKENPNKPKGGVV